MWVSARSSPALRGRLYPGQIASLGDGDGLCLIVLTVVSTADAAYPVRDPTERLNEVEATAQLGSWSWDIEKDVVSWSDELYRIYGLSPQSMPITARGRLGAGASR